MMFIVGIKCKPTLKNFKTKKCEPPGRRVHRVHISTHKAVAVFLEQIKEAMALLLS